MKIWKYRIKQEEKSITETDWERGTVNAETFEKAVEKVRKHMKDEYGDIALYLAECSLLVEVDLI